MVWWDLRPLQSKLPKQRNCRGEEKGQRREGSERVSRLCRVATAVSSRRWRPGTAGMPPARARRLLGRPGAAAQPPASPCGLCLRPARPLSPLPWRRRRASRPARPPAGRRRPLTRLDRQRRAARRRQACSCWRALPAHRRQRGVACPAGARRQRVPWAMQPWPRPGCWEAALRRQRSRTWAAGRHRRRQCRR